MKYLVLDTAPTGHENHTRTTCIIHDGDRDTYTPKATDSKVTFMSIAEANGWIKSDDRTPYEIAYKVPLIERILRRNELLEK